uniref:EARP and GARP complex-interacting protein 1 n=1 Tax=Urocitellus parryii TaxID=9999 RepID=A0A8D2KG62_UROPR
MPLCCAELPQHTPSSSLFPSGIGPSSAGAPRGACWVRESLLPSPPVWLSGDTASPGGQGPHPWVLAGCWPQRAPCVFLVSLGLFRMSPAHWSQHDRVQEASYSGHPDADWGLLSGEGPLRPLGPGWVLRLSWLSPATASSTPASRFPAISAAGHLVDVLLSCPASRLAKRPCFQPGLSPSGSLLHRPLLQGWLASLCPNLASSASLEGKGQLKFTSGRWSPHHNCTQVATASDTTLRGWDTRSMSQIYCIENAHGQLVRDLDFNPNKQYYLASCGDDCKVKFWDTRNVTEPVKTLEEHSHWVWSVRYNHSHDQLVLTGSSDSRVILSNMVSISSEPFGHLVDDDDVSDPEEHHADEKSKEPLQDNVIATYEEHEDSVYAVDWSSADPWLFASLSYDGRLVINRVPRALKYHILL